jgi:Family of unknown function (DUF5989)
MSTLRELVAYAKARRKWWLLPIIVLLAPLYWLRQLWTWLRRSR